MADEKNDDNDEKQEEEEDETCFDAVAAAFEVAVFTAGSISGVFFCQFWGCLYL